MFKNFKITTVRVLVFSLLLAFLAGVLTTPERDFIAFIGGSSLLSVLVCLAILFFRFVIKLACKLMNKDQFNFSEWYKRQTEISKQKREKNWQKLKVNRVEIKKESQKTNNETNYKPESSKQSWAMTNGSAVIWDGSLEAVSFTSFDKKHKGVLVRLILKDDGEFYFDIADEDTGEIETVREMELKTKIRVKSSSYDLSDLCRIKLKINLQRMYAYAEEVRSEARKPELIKTFDPVEVSFIYESQENGKTRRNIKATKYYRSKKGAEYFEGFCYTRNEERMFKASRIQSKLKVGKDYYFFNEFVDSFVNVN